jgi:predicted RNA-binding protein with RPS1 domain
MRSPRQEDDRRIASGRKRLEVNRERLATFNVGDMVEGTITGISLFGAFVDIGVGKDGLVHVSELSEGRIDKPGDVVQVGETHSFKILELDPEGSRISLSLRRAKRMQKMRELEPGQWLDGTVSGLAPFGAFVDIGVGRDGLVHISQLSEQGVNEQGVNKVEDVVKIGDRVRVQVFEVDALSKRITLTMRPEFSTLSKSSELYTTTGESDEEEFEGNATLEDLMNIFGGSRRQRRQSDKGYRRVYYKRLVSRRSLLQELYGEEATDNETPAVLPESVAGDSFEAPEELLAYKSASADTTAEKNIQFFALARALIEEGDKAVVSKTYTIQAGLSPQEIEGFISESMDVPVNKHDELIAIDILCHESEHIELLSDWQATIYYRADQRTAQFVEFLFRALKPGQASISIDFYHKQRWLRTISFEFEAVEALQPVSAQPEE